MNSIEAKSSNKDESNKPLYAPEWIRVGQAWQCSWWGETFHLAREKEDLWFLYRAPSLLLPDEFRASCRMGCVGRDLGVAQWRAACILNEYLCFGNFYQRFREAPVLFSELQRRLSQAPQVSSSTTLQDEVFEYYHRAAQDLVSEPHPGRGLRQQCAQITFAHVQLLLQQIPDAKLMPQASAWPSDVWFTMGGAVPLVGKVRFIPAGSHSCYAPWVVRMTSNDPSSAFAEFVERQLVTSAALKPAIVHLSEKLRSQS
ncbi:hypothetical protein [Nocardiopsis sp. CNS-639]|uniref:hypothetical protein n=1 Tax=Nocardiopsis sp. CNS-639 TaxID=1169153 RepID=UPI0012DF3343|nr:hypothetical protein [Nocardiopsis sp. CNS-639]